MIERNTALVPRSRSAPRNGITPLSIYGSSTVKVAPSRPSNRVGGFAVISHLLTGRLTMQRDEAGQVRDGDVALLHRTASDLLEVLGKGEPAEALLDHRREDDDVQRL